MCWEACLKKVLFFCGSIKQLILVLFVIQFPFLLSSYAILLFFMLHYCVHCFLFATQSCFFNDSDSIDFVFILQSILKNKNNPAWICISLITSIKTETMLTSPSIRCGNDYSLYPFISAPSLPLCYCFNMAFYGQLISNTFDMYYTFKEFICILINNNIYNNDLNRSMF